MEELLRELLADLAAIAERHGEINDSDVEELLTQSIFDGFLKPEPGFSLPLAFGMANVEGDALVRAALARFVERATPLADRLGLNFHDRLAAFQGLGGTYGPSDLCYNDFFRYTPPEQFDALGNTK